VVVMIGKYDFVSEEKAASRLIRMHCKTSECLQSTIPATRYLSIRAFAGALILASAFFVPVTEAQNAPVAPMVGELFPAEYSTQGTVLPAGSGISITSGSQVAAGVEPALLRLERGGDVRLCARTGMVINTLSGTDGLLFSMNTGDVVLRYALRDVADTLLTPDFRLLLAGPGTFHFALGVNGRGDTCVKTLPGNTSRIIVSEVFGNGTYQVKEDEAVLFSGGKLAGRSSEIGACGCLGSIQTQTSVAEQADHPDTGNPATSPESAGPPKPAARINAPFVFSAGSTAEPYSVARVTFSTLPSIFFVQEKIEPAVPRERAPEVSAKQGPSPPETPQPAKEKKKKKGFFGRIFGSIFGG
jgi:hypothetical protein